MTYVRHRDRMVQESVREDLINTLIACRWLAGTTTRTVVSPYDRAAGFQIVTTTPDQTLKMLGQHPLTLVDYYPESTTDDHGLVDDPESAQTAPNTLAMDDGQPGTPELLELGSRLMTVPYRFTFAFMADSVGIAQALMNDLRDRYLGNAVNGDVVALYAYNDNPTDPIVQMEVDDFSYVQAADDEADVYEITLFYGQLTLTDLVDDSSVGAHA